MSTQGEDPVSKLQPERISVAEAAARRQHASLVDAAESSQAVFSGDEHDRRQKFRRLINPGITRPNSKETALAALKVSLVSSQCSGTIPTPISDPSHHRHQPYQQPRRRQIPSVQAYEQSHQEESHRCARCSRICDRGKALSPWHRVAHHPVVGL